MSLPPALIDQLLTGYLDEVLTADELARVEKLLETDPSVAEELGKLQEVRAALKAVALADKDIRLDAGFAGRVIDEAVLRARSEGVSDEHPLLRLDRQPVSLEPAASTSARWRNAAVMVGLAASIALAVFLTRSDQERETGGSNSQIAQVQPETSKPGKPEVIGTEVEPATAIAVVPKGNIDGGDLEASSVNPPENNIPAPTLDKNAIAGTPNLSDEPNKLANDPAGANGAPPMLALGAILVVNVELTDEGRERDVFNVAMERAGLEASSQKKVSEEIVGVIENPQVQKPQGAAVVYLQAPAKALDRLCLGLIADRAGVKSVGMSLAMNAPVMRAIGAVRQDPTAIRHESSSLQLLSDDDSLAQLTETLLNLDFVGMRDGVAVPSTGADQMAEILLLVK